MPAYPDNRDDVIDSRDVIARIKDLEAELEDEDPNEVDPDAREELAALKALTDEGRQSPDWHHGETLIRDSYFRDYAKQLAEDIGAVDPELQGRWPYTCIDWDEAAEELKNDYFEVDFDGVTYWISY
jgi:hypothetical protein